MSTVFDEDSLAYVLEVLDALKTVEAVQAEDGPIRVAEVRFEYSPGGVDADLGITREMFGAGDLKVSVFDPDTE